MNVLGIDVGYSESKATNSYCVLKVDEHNRVIDLAVKPQKFCITNAEYELDNLFGYIGKIELIAVDAPLTVKEIDDMPSTGREIEKVFSKAEFNNYYRGPQPSSISVIKPGWLLYKAGMRMVKLLHKINEEMTFTSLKDIKEGKRNGVIEIIPKLTQSLLVSQDTVTGRGKAKIDDYIFPKLFPNDGQIRDAFGKTMEGYYLSNDLENEIANISSNARKYHEELASIVSALQGVMLIVGEATVVGFEGDYEGYYLLPKYDYWHQDWKRNFEIARKQHRDIKVIDL